MAIDLCFIALYHLNRLSVIPILHLILLLCELPLELLQLGVVLLNSIVLLIDLLLQRFSDLSHVLVVGLDLLTCLPHICPQFLMTLCSLIQPNV